MNVMRYALLVKDLKDQNKIVVMQKIKDILRFVLMFALFSNMIFTFADQLELGSIILISVFALDTVFYFIFFAVVSRLRKKQILDPAESIDQTIFEINEKYGVLVKNRRILILVSIACFVLFTTLGTLYLVSADIENIQALTMTFAVIFVLSIFALAIYDVVKQQKFVRSVSNEMDILQDRFYEIRGLSKQQQLKSRKLNMFNISDSEKMLRYIYPDDILRKKVSKMSLYFILPMVLICAVLGFFLPSAFQKASQQDYTLLIVLGVAFVLLIVGTIVGMLRYQKYILAQQNAIFLEDKEKYKYHLELHEAYKAFQKTSNTICLIFYLSALVICVVLALIFTDNETVAGIALIGFVGCTFLNLAIVMIATSSYRKKVKEIEFNIDQHLKNIQNNVDDDQNTEQQFDQEQMFDQEYSQDVEQTNDDQKST